MLCCGAGGVALAVKRAVERANDTPSTIEAGEEFAHDGFDAAAGWEVVEERGAFDVTGLTLTNRAIGSRAAFLELTLYRDGALVGTVSCSSLPIEHGGSGPTDCFSADAYDDFDTVRVADTF